MLVAVLVLLVIALTIALGFIWLHRNRPGSVLQAPGIRRILKSHADATRCMGFDKVDQGGPLPRLVDCHELITEKTLHRIATTFAPGEDGEEVESAGEEGTAVMAEYCSNHCPGNCNKGCPVPSKETSDA